MSISFLDGVLFVATANGTSSFTVNNAITGWHTPASAGANNGASYRYRAYSTDASQWEIGTGTYYTANSTLARTTVLFSSSANTMVNFATAPTVALTIFAEDIQAFMANNGLISNSSGTFVNANNGLTANSSGLFVKPGDTSIIANSSGVYANTTSVSAPSSIQADNLGISFAQNANSNLIVSLKQADGISDPGPAPNNVVVGMSIPSSPAFNYGAFNRRSVTGPLSITIPAPLGLGIALFGTLYFYLLDNLGTLELAASATDFTPNTTFSTTALSSTSTNAAIAYSTTTRNFVPFIKIAQAFFLPSNSSGPGLPQQAGTSTNTVRLAPFPPNLGILPYQPIPSNNIFGVGTAIAANQTSGSAVTSLGQVAGTSLKLALPLAGTVTTAQSGTWTNITGQTVNTATVGFFVRTA